MVVVDTNILIAIIRGNEMASALIRKQGEEICISVVSHMELSVGATNRSRREAVDIVTRTHSVLPLSKAIGERALSLIQTYSTPSRSLFLPDALIAATCMENNATLLTFNTKDFQFIKGLRLGK
jgi:predicted nucleic acid-binding protein